MAQPLLAAADVIRDKQDIPSRSAPFLQPRSKWQGHLRDPETNRDRLWVVAVLFHLREAFRSGDVWLAHSRRYSDLKQALVALREIGRIERTLFIIDWLLDTDMQRRAQIGLNKGEAHHALKNALRIGRQGEIRDRTTEGQHFRMAGLNLLTAIIIYWNTKQLGFAVAARQKAGLDTPAYLLSHISPLGWAHIILTGEYRWRQMAENP